MVHLPKKNIITTEINRDGRMEKRQKEKMKKLADGWRQAQSKKLQRQTCRRSIKTKSIKTVKFGVDQQMDLHHYVLDVIMHYICFFMCNEYKDGIKLCNPRTLW